MAKEETQARYLTNQEITELTQICHAMFSSANLSNVQATAYTNILRHKFSGMTYRQIMKQCEDAAANPPKTDFRFTPSFMATILRGHEKINQTQSSEERVATQAERYKYRQEFLNDLYADFNAFKAGMKPKRIQVWQYVAELFVRNGIAERLPDHKERGGEAKTFKQIMNIYEEFVLDCFRVLIKNNQHVSQIINGLEN